MKMTVLAEESVRAMAGTWKMLEFEGDDEIETEAYKNKTGL